MGPSSLSIPLPLGFYPHWFSTFSPALNSFKRILTYSGLFVLTNRCRSVCPSPSCLLRLWNNNIPTIVIQSHRHDNSSHTCLSSRLWFSWNALDCKLQWWSVWDNNPNDPLHWHLNRHTKTTRSHPHAFSAEAPVIPWHANGGSLFNGQIFGHNVKPAQALSTAHCSLHSHKLTPLFTHTL